MKLNQGPHPRVVIELRTLARDRPASGTTATPFGIPPFEATLQRDKIVIDYLL